MSWDFLGKLTRPIGNFEEKILGATPGGTPIWRLRQKLAEGFHHESGLSNSQAIMLGAAIGTGAAGAGGAFAGGAGAGAGAGASELGTAGAWGGAEAGGVGAGAGAGYSVVPNYTPSAEASTGGAMDMSGSLANPSAASGPTIFDQSPTAGKPNFSMPGQQQQRRMPRHSVYDVSPTAAAPGALTDASGNPLPPQQVALLQALAERQQQQQGG